jgi:hypothetical protein
MLAVLAKSLNADLGTITPPPPGQRHEPVNHRSDVRARLMDHEDHGAVIVPRQGD